MPHWLQLPIVKGPAEDRTKIVNYKISERFIDGNAGINRATPIFQLWAHIVGQLPPINNVSRIANAALPPTLTTLLNSVACFKGLQRPHDNEHDGKSVLVFVINPLVTLAYHVDMVCVARTLKVPQNTVLTVQVRPQSSLLRDESQLDGVVTRLEFVSSGAGDPRLPKDFETRYAEVLWRDQ